MSFLMSLPKDARALIRLQVDHINRTLVPSFYRYLQAQDAEKQISSGREFHQSIQTLVSLFERAEKELGSDQKVRRSLGLWVEDGEMSLADVMVGPCTFLPRRQVDLELTTTLDVGIFRATNVLKHYRGFELPEGEKFSAWVNKLINHPSFKATCSTEELYIDSYERYAQQSVRQMIRLLPLNNRYAYNRPNTSQVAEAINTGRGLP